VGERLSQKSRDCGEYMTEVQTKMWSSIGKGSETNVNDAESTAE